MHISDVFMAVNNQIMEEDIKKVTPELISQLKIAQGLSIDFPSIVSLLHEFSLDIDNLYFCENSLISFWYIQEHSFVSVDGLSAEIFKTMRLVDRINAQEKMLKAKWDKKEYSEYFTSLNIASPQFLFYSFQKRYDQIPDEFKYEIFRDMYTDCDYGFRYIDKDIVKRTFCLNKDRSFVKMLRPDADGYLTVFRGLGEKSTPASQAYSWTLSKKTAIWFAARFNEIQCQLYTAKVHIHDVIDFIDDRNEKEILVLPESLIDLQKIEILNFDKDFLGWIQETDILYEYHLYCKEAIKKDLFHNANGVHGVLHAKRVLLLSMILSKMEELDDFDAVVMYLAAAFHDIGRTNDDVDNMHGKKSEAKFKKQNVYKDRLGIKWMMNEDSELLPITNAIIRNHSISDEAGIQDINSDVEIFDKDRAIRLYKLFKDADGLDRVRLGDLDTDMLRSESAAKLPFVAEQMLKNIE